MSDDPTFFLRLGPTPYVRINECVLRTAEEANAFAQAFNALCATAWPEVFGDAEPTEEDAQEGEQEGDEDAGQEGEHAQGADATASDEPPPARDKPKRRPPAIHEVAPGSKADLVLAQIRAGVVDTVAIADRLDMATTGVAALKRMLAAGGHWPGDAP